MNELNRKIEQEIETFASFSSTRDGVTRLPFSRENDLVIEYIKSRLTSMGKQVFADSYGNIMSADADIGFTEGKTYFVSHYDSVPNGGKYDGTAGIVLGLLLIESLGKPYRNQVELIAFNIEESSMFGRASIGSKTFFEGENSIPDTYALLNAPVSLKSSVRKKRYKQYADIEKPSFSNSTRFLEVHIDQSRELWDSKNEIGIADKIAGQKRLILQFKGSTGHSSLMNLSTRKDSLYCASKVITKVGEMALAYNASGVIGTVTRIKNEPNVTNMIPETTELFVDIRGIEKEALEHFRDELVDFGESHTRRSRLAFTWNTVSEYDPVSLNGDFASLLEKQMGNERISCRKMNSMAWHDSAEISRFYKTNLLFVANKTGESHSPQEQMDINAFRKLLVFLISFFGGNHDSNQKR